MAKGDDKGTEELCTEKNPSEKTEKNKETPQKTHQTIPLCPKSLTVFLWSALTSDYAILRDCTLISPLNISHDATWKVHILRAPMSDTRHLFLSYFFKDKVVDKTISVVSPLWWLICKKNKQNNWTGADGDLVYIHNMMTPASCLNADVQQWGH